MLDQPTDRKVYYYACLYELVDYTRILPEYLALFKETFSRKESQFQYIEGEVFFRDLSDLLNLAFKNNVTLPTELIERMKKASDYYEWVLDMEHFDYSKFNPLWILQYPTVYYLKRIFSVHQIKNSLKVWLRENYQPQIAYFYALHG